MNGLNRLKILLIGGFLWLIAAGFSQVEAAIDLSGSFTSELTIRQYEQSANDPHTLKYAENNLLRLNFKDFPNPYTKVEGSFDSLLLAGDSADTYLALAPEERSHSFLIGSTCLLPLFETRKLYGSFFSDHYTFTLGRQIINYGVGSVFSPIDCFSKVDLQDVGLGRKGSDIARVQIPLGDLAGIEGVTNLPTTTNTASAIKVFGNLQGYDLSLIGIYKKPQEESLIGFTFKGDLELGIHGELVAHFQAANNVDYFEGMLGADYSFNQNKLLLLVEYYYNSNPIDPNNLTPTELLNLDRSFFGSQYLFGQASYSIDEIRSLNVSGIYNLTVGSWIGIGQFFYNIFQNTDLLLFTRYYKGNLNGLNSQTGPKVEYGVRMEIKF